MRKREAWALRWSLVVAAAVPCPGLATAQHALPEIGYAAPVECPDREAFVARLRARRRPGTAARALNTRRFDVRIELRGRRVIGQLRVLAADGALSQRQIEAATCDEAADALALIAALTLEPGEGAGADPARSRAKKPAATSAGEATPVAGAEAGEASAGPEASAATASAPARPTEAAAAERSPSAEPAPDAEASAPTPEVPDGDEDPAAEAPDPTGPRFAGFGLFASGMAASGVAPDILPALQLSAVAATRLGGAEFALRLGGRVTPANTTSAGADGRAELRFLGGAAALCAGPRLGAAQLGVWGCAAAELGQISARGEDTRAARHSERLWAALGPGLLARWDVVGPLALLAGAELLFPLVRDRYDLADTAIHRVPSAAFRAELGLGLQIR